MNKKKILVVEDDELLRNLYIETLQGDEYEVTSAIDGDDAFAKMKVGGYDLVLLDIILPKQSGLDVMNALKTNPPAVKNNIVLFLTNLDKSEEIKEALTLGNGYLIKSQITPGDLINEVKAYLEKIPMNSASTQAVAASPDASGSVK